MAGYPADSFRDKFGDCMLFTTGTLAGDVEHMGMLLEQAEYEILSGTQDWWALDREDPQRSLATMAGNLALLSTSLIDAGFYPPAVDYREDPIGFLQRNKQFLLSIGPLVVEPSRTVH